MERFGIILHVFGEFLTTEHFGVVNEVCIPK